MRRSCIRPLCAFLLRQIKGVGRGADERTSPRGTRLSEPECRRRTEAAPAGRLRPHADPKFTSYSSVTFFEAGIAFFPPLVLFFFAPTRKQISVVFGVLCCRSPPPPLSERL